jgi:glucose-6-phosphate-specific signal transduction histidine kinase
MKRFVLYLVLVPIIAPLIAGVWLAVRYEVNQFHKLREWPGVVLWRAYFNWLLPALAIATADRFLPSGKWKRLGTIAAVGCVSTLLTEVALYGLPSRGWGWGPLLPGLTGAIAALLCCLLLDQLNKERLSKLGSAISSTIKTLRRWPA